MSQETKGDSFPWGMFLHRVTRVLCTLQLEQVGPHYQSFTSHLASAGFQGLLFEALQFSHKFSVRLAESNKSKWTFSDLHR